MLLYLLLVLQSKRYDELVNVPQFVKQHGNLDSFESFVAQTFNDRFLTFGPQPKASMWYSKTRQSARFAKIAEIIAACSYNGKCSVNDIGCGYGGFLDYLTDHYADLRISYAGYDIANSVIDYCVKQKQTTNAQFYLGKRPKTSADFNIMSGTFNYAPGLTAERWVAYLKTELKIVYSKSQRGLIFNLMIADAPKISQASIAYAGLEDILSFCQAKLGHTKLFDDPLLPHERTFWIKK